MRIPSHRRVSVPRLGALSLLLLLLLLLEFAAGQSTSPQCRSRMHRCPSGGPCADLIIDGPRAQRTARVEIANFGPSSCAVIEGCTVPGRRKLLRFDMAVANVGSADLPVGVPFSGAMRSCFEWSPCHAHYHFSGFANYQLLRGNTLVGTGAKASSCLQDAYRWNNAGNAPTIPTNQLYWCSNQGIHRGYMDVYGAHLDCQWIDVTNVSPGTYTLRVEVNRERVLDESRYDNNVVSFSVVVPNDGSTPTAPNPTGCTAQGGCNSCATTTGCGWCAGAPGMAAGCSYGSYLGPASGSCPQWTWAARECSTTEPGTSNPPPTSGGGSSGSCNTRTTCASCASTNGCGWCPATSTCSAGTATGPASGRCPGAWQFGSSNSCGDCSAHNNDCNACTKATGCGMCRTNGRCSAGTWLGPSGLTCSAWAWSHSQCTGTAPPAQGGSGGGGGSSNNGGGTSTPPPSNTGSCSSATSCAACAATRGCGWCPSTSSCRSGTASGPSSGAQCPSWQFGASNTCGNCGSHTACGSCTKATGCGFCQSNNRCLAGTWLGPAGSSCSQWTWSNSQCSAPPPSASTSCAVNRDCNSCANSRGCGWCPATRTCHAGTWLGPSSGTCPTWTWQARACTSAAVGVSRVANPSLRYMSRTAAVPPSSSPSWSNASSVPSSSDESVSVDPELSLLDSLHSDLDPLSIVQSMGLSLDETLKSDAAGNYFKQGSVLDEGFREESTGNWIKTRDDVDLDTAERPVDRVSVEHATRAATDRNVAATDADTLEQLAAIDPYDPDPFNPELPHGHREHMHMESTAAAGGPRAAPTGHLWLTVGIGIGALLFMMW